MNQSNGYFRSVTTTQLAGVGIFGLLYFLWFGGVVGLRKEHVFLFVLIAVCYLANDRTRRFLAAFAAFLAFWMIYDSMRIMPNYKVNPVHISEPYLFDKQWFGIGEGESRQTLNEYFATRTTAPLDVMAAFFYLMWVPLPMAFAAWLWVYNKPLFVRFSYGYLFTNLVGFVIYYLYPAAPPWYVELNGFEFHPDTPRSAAGLNNFDQLFGVRFFHNMYQRNASVFAAIPSLHSAYPFVTLFYAMQVNKRWPVIVFSVLTLGIWFSAVYLRHHYVIDVIFGALTAVTGYVLFEWLRQKTFLKRWFDQLLAYI